MSKPPIVVFDLDGTLAETAGDLIATLNAVMAQEGLPGVPLEKARDLIGAGARALIERGFATAGRALPPAKLDALFAFFLGTTRKTSSFTVTSSKASRTRSTSSRDRDSRSRSAPTRWRGMP